MLDYLLKGWDIFSAIAMAAAPAILLFAFWLWLRSKGGSSSGGGSGKKGGGGGSGGGGRKSSGGRGATSGGGRGGGGRGGGGRGGGGGGGASNALTGLGNAGMGLGQGLGNALTGLGNTALGLGQGLGGLANGLGGLAAGLGSGGKSLAQGVGGLAEIGGKGIKTVSSAVWNESAGVRKSAGEAIKTVVSDATYGFKRPDWEIEAEIPPHLRNRQTPFGAMAWPVDINDEREVERVLREGGVDFYWKEDENGDRQCVVNAEHLDNARQVMGEAGWDMSDEEASVFDWEPAEAAEWADGSIPGEYRKAPEYREGPESPEAPEAPEVSQDLPALPAPE